MAVGRVVVVGAGIVGLSTAWFLAERGVEVVVLDRSEVAAGSSWGNAGWLSPGMALPLAEPSVLRYGLGALLDPASPLAVPIPPGPGLTAFLLGFARRCTMPTWRRTMASYVPLNEQSLEAYDQLTAGGVEAPTIDAPIMAGFLQAKDSQALLHEFDLVRQAGLEIHAEVLDGAAARAQVPILTDEVECAVRISGQRYINPPAFMAALADSLRARGVEILEGRQVSRVRPAAGGVACDLLGAAPIHADQVVLATGAWLPDLARSLGVRVRMTGGRGYSFSVAVEPGAVPNPVYFPAERVACTPLGDRLRIGGTMEFESPDAGFRPARIQGIIDSARPLLRGIDWTDLDDQWVGARPVTVDGLPVVGRTALPGVWVAGGHGMWGITQGPLTGRLLADYLCTGEEPDELKPLNPLR